MLYFDSRKQNMGILEVICTYSDALGELFIHQISAACTSISKEALEGPGLQHAMRHFLKHGMFLWSMDFFGVWINNLTNAF